MENSTSMNENEINSWAEAISSLPDKQFFNTMRLYLGEIKTPYNKQRLTQQLAAFIKSPEHINSLLTLLDRFDVTVLTAISLIPNASQDTLVNFFHTEYSVAEIYAEIINLTERLVIYKEKSDTGKEFIKINPLIRENLLPYLDSKLIFPDYVPATFSNEDIFSISPNLLAAFITYIRIRGISCKSDGTIKKNDKNRLEEIFPGKENFIQLLMNAFVNLSLVYEAEDGKGYKIELARIKKFAELSELQQYTLLCAAAVSRFSKEGLKKEAQLLIDCLTSIPENGLSRDSILRLAFLVGTFTEDGNALAHKSRFSRILEAARHEAGAEPEQNAELLDRMIDCAVEFGLLRKTGKTEDDIDLYVSAKELFPSDTTDSRLTNDSLPNTSSIHQSPKVLNIDSTFTVTLLPGLKLKELIPLTDFMLVKKCGVVTEFEITRQSVSEGFDNSITPEIIFERIENNSYYEIPQNLKINITEWYNSYSSAKLYYGYILKVTDNNITFVEKNPNIQKYIKEKLTEGIYLLNIPAGTDISDFISESSLEFLGNVKTSHTKSEFSTFPLLRNGHKPAVLESKKNLERKQTSISEADKLLKNLKACLQKMDMDKHIKESLEYRISNRLILSENQLKKASVRTEILEADGMDFAGKVHLIEAAVKDEDLMEIQMPDSDGSGNFFTIMGHPLGISKQPGEAVMRLQIEPTGDIQNLLVSRITHLRRLRF